MTTAVGGRDCRFAASLIDFPTSGAQVSNIVTVTADAYRRSGVAAVQFFVDGVAASIEDTSDPYALAWDTRTVSNGAHTLSAALATDVAAAYDVLRAGDGQRGKCQPFPERNPCDRVQSADRYQVPARRPHAGGELAGTDTYCRRPIPDRIPRPSCNSPTSASDGVQQGIYDIALDPNFATNHYYYIFYTLGSPNRRSPFAVHRERDLTGTVAGSELVICTRTRRCECRPPRRRNQVRQRRKDLLHDRRAFRRRRRAGSHQAAGQDLALSTWTALYRRTTRSTMAQGPTTTPYGRSVCATRTAPTTMHPPAGSSSATSAATIDSTAIEEVDHRSTGRKLRLAERRGAQRQSRLYGAGLLLYPHNGTSRRGDHGRICLSRNPIPGSYQGSFFFADYTQNWIKRLTFDANGNVTGVFNFEPLDGTRRRTLRRYRILDRGSRRRPLLRRPWLFRSERRTSTFGVSKIHRISFVDANLPPVVSASAQPRPRANPAHRQLLQRRFV